MIINNTAALIVQSKEHSVDRVTGVLGIEPTHTRTKGEVISARRSVIAAQHHIWVHRVEGAEVASDDKTGMGALTLLVQRLAPLAERLATLRPDYRTIISWGGFSDSSEGGFVMPADLSAALGRLGCDLYGTAYLDAGDTPVGQPFAIDLTARERAFLARGLAEWGGPAHVSEAFAVALGLVDASYSGEVVERLGRSVSAGEPMTLADWQRALGVVELMFASDRFGSGLEWETTTGFGDTESIGLLRDIQRRLTSAGTGETPHATRS